MKRSILNIDRISLGKTLDHGHFNLDLRSLKTYFGSEQVSTKIYKTHLHVSNSLIPIFLYVQPIFFMTNLTESSLLFSSLACYINHCNISSEPHIISDQKHSKTFFGAKLCGSCNQALISMDPMNRPSSGRGSFPAR